MNRMKIFLVFLGLLLAGFEIRGKTELGIEGERFLSKFPDERTKRGPDGLLNIEDIAETYWMLHHQPRSTWTLELDLRPWAEPF